MLMTAAVVGKDTTPFLLEFNVPDLQHVRHCNEYAGRAPEDYHGCEG